MLQKREENISQASKFEGKGVQDGCWTSDDACLETPALRGRPGAELEEAGMKMLKFSLRATRMETIKKEGHMAYSRSNEKRMKKIGD